MLFRSGQILAGFLVNSIAGNWCEGAVLRRMSILGAKSSSRAAQIYLNRRGMTRSGIESLPAPGRTFPWLQDRSWFGEVQVSIRASSPPRPPHPWDSPGKNTGVGCHFLPQCMKVKSETEIAQSRPTPSDPMDCSPPGSSIHGIFQARVLEWGAPGH